MPETDRVADKCGCQITVCRPHQLEYCSRCGIDYVDVNRDARRLHTAEAAKKPNGQSLGDGLLRSGTPVVCPEGPLGPRTDAKIRGFEENDCFGLRCYIVEMGKDRVTEVVSVQEVHEEWYIVPKGDSEPFLIRDMLEHGKPFVK